MKHINILNLTAKQKDIYHSLSGRVYGSVLAQLVAEKLAQPNSQALYFSHRDYCGMGISAKKGAYQLVSVYDGYCDFYEADNRYGSTPLLTFKTKPEFIIWLAQQSDRSMALIGENFNNQTITLWRLVWYLQEDYSPVWNTSVGFHRTYEDITNRNQTNRFTALGMDTYVWGHAFELDISDQSASSENERSTLLDLACINESKRIEKTDDSTILSLNVIHSHWKTLQFENAQQLLLDALRYDLAYTSSENTPLDKAMKFQQELLQDFSAENTYAYTNYAKSPFKRESYGGWPITDDATFDLAIVFINKKKMLFCYVLAED